MSTTQTHTKAMPHMRALAAGIRANIPTLLWGDPGIAKTATITAFGEASGMHVETVIGSVRESTDFLGLPYEDDGTVKYTALSWAHRVAEANKGLLFFDELTTAPPSVQRAMLRILQERVVGEFQLPDSVSIVAAANPASVAVDGWDLPAPVANRLMHIDWKIDTDGWIAGVMTDFEGITPQTVDQILGAGDDSYRVRVRANITTFLRSRPDMVHKMPTDPVTAGKGWPSPRSWTNAMAALGELDPNDNDAALLVLAGCVGEGAATEYLAWEATNDLYDPDSVLADPSIVDWEGSRPDKLFALVYSIAALTQLRGDKDTWLAAVKVLEACAEGGRPDAAAPAVKLLIDVKPKNTAVPDSLREAFSHLFAATGKWARADSEAKAA